MYAYSNNGLSWRAWNDAGNLASGEVYFAAAPTTEQLASAFAGYTAAVAGQAAQATFDTAMASGLAITSTGTPALNATYALDSTSQAQVFQIGTYAQSFSEFTNGTTSMSYPDITGTPHTFTVTAFVALFQAIARYVTAAQTTLETIQAGGSASWPAATATIA